MEAVVRPRRFATNTGAPVAIKELVHINNLPMALEWQESSCPSCCTGGAESGKSHDHMMCVRACKSKRECVRESFFPASKSNNSVIQTIIFELNLHVYPFTQRTRRPRDARRTMILLIFLQILEPFLPRFRVGIGNHPLKAYCI